MKRRVLRNNEPAEVFTYYKLPLSGIVPDYIPEKELTTLAAQVIEGDKKAVAAGYQAGICPSASELSDVLTKAQKELADVAPADRQFNMAQEALVPIRAKADEVINDVIADLEYGLRKKEPSVCRRIMRTYGVTFAYAKGEPADPDDTGNNSTAK